jgi:hypothetical protein
VCAAARAIIGMARRAKAKLALEPRPPRLQQIR